LATRQVADDVSGLERQVQPFDERPGVGVEGALPEEHAAAAWLSADIDVLRDREVGHQVELLVDDADAEFLGVLGVRHVQRRSVQVKLPPVRGVDPGQQLHERRLACAVLSDERQHLAVA